jgi:hypothetical protein
MQEVAPLDLHAVAGEVEQADGVASQPVAEGADGGVHLALVGIEFQVDLEAGALQRFGHRLRIVGGVVKRHVRVAAVADDERLSRLGRLRGRGDQRRPDDERQPGQPDRAGE